MKSVPFIEELLLKILPETQRSCYMLLVKAPCHIVLMPYEFALVFPEFNMLLTKWFS